MEARLKAPQPQLHVIVTELPGRSIVMYFIAKGISLKKVKRKEEKMRSRQNAGIFLDFLQILLHRYPHVCRSHFTHKIGKINI